MRMTPSLSISLLSIREQNCEETKLQTMPSYLHHFSSQMGKSLLKMHDQVPHIALDHCYSKPWNAHPYATRNRPARALFFSYPQRLPITQDVVSQDEVIDVDSSSPRLLPPYDMIKARALMTEWERHIALSHVDEGQDDWEETICRVGWSLAQNRLFNKVAKVLHADHLARLANEGSPNEPLLRRIHIDKSAERLRQILASIQWDLKRTQWLHLTLTENLCSSYLIAYFDILQSLKAKVPSLVDKMISVTSTSPGRGALTNSETTILLNKRPWDPVLPSLPQNKLKKLPGCPLLLIVPFGPSQSGAYQSRRMRFWHSQLAHLGKVVPVTMHTSGGGRSSVVSQCLEHMIGATRTKIIELKSHFPNRPIVLIGWSIASLIACQIALVEKVAAVVCIGFSFTGIKGSRGEVDDPLLESRTPTLFIIGQNTSLCGIDDIEDLREKMKTDTSLVVVGGADEWIRISHAKKKAEGINQTIVDRCLLDEISDFLGGILTNLPLQAPEMSYGNRRAFSGPSPFFKDNKRRKRKHDGFGEDDDLLLPLTTSKYKVANAIKKEFRLMGTTQSTTVNKSVGSGQSTLIFDGGHQTLSQLLDAGIPPATNVKRNYSINRQLGTVKKPRLSQGIIESTSSDSSSNSAGSSAPTTWTDVEEAAAQVSKQAASVTLPTANKRQPSGGLSLHIGTLSSISHLHKQTMQGTKKSGLQMQSLVNKQTSAANTYGNMEFNLPASTSGSSLIHLSKSTTISTPRTLGSSISIQTLPVRSAFSVPRSGVKPTIGISSLMTYSLGTRGVTMSNPTSLLLTNAITTPDSINVTGTSGSTITGSSDGNGVNVASQFSSVEPVQLGSVVVHKPVTEPNQEQVQAIQKLQFHDFPLTTASLTKSPVSGSSIVTQAKILSSCGLDLKRLKNLSFGQGTAMPAASLLITSGSKTTSSPIRDTSSGCATNASSTVELQVPEISTPAPSCIEVERSTNPVVNYTLSSVKLHLPERLDVQELTPVSSVKIPQVSLIMLTPEKHIRRDEAIIIDDSTKELQFGVSSVLDSTSVLPESSYLLLSPPSPVQQIPPTSVVQSGNIISDQDSTLTTDASRTLEAEALLNLANSGTFESQTENNAPIAQVQESLPSQETPAILTQNEESPKFNLGSGNEKETTSSVESSEPSTINPGTPTASANNEQNSKEQVANSPVSTPRSSRFKPPPFPTIAATRTRRIRVPKYMYYDL